MKITIEDIANIICSVTQDCSGKVHDYSFIEHHMKIRYLCKAKEFLKISKLVLDFEKNLTIANELNQKQKTTNPIKGEKDNGKKAD